MTSTALSLALALSLAAPPLAAQQMAAPEQPSAAWESLRPMLFPERAVAAAGEMIAIDAPYRAHDAAATPVEVAITPPLGRVVRHVTLLIDENPAPVAAEIEVGPGMGREIRLATRVRVDAYSNVRVVAELDDGSLRQAARFVKASGGCSAPASADPNAEIADLGRMKLRRFEDPSPEAQLLIRHPNHSGFQVDQVSLLHIPPWFVDQVTVRQGDQLVFRLQGGISLSENPALRFGYVPNGEPLAVRAEDTEGGVFEAAFAAAGG